MSDLLAEAINHQKAGRFEEAERLYRLLLQQSPRHPLVNHNLGILAVQRGRPEQGISHFKTAVDSGGNVGQFWASYARALHVTGQMQEALEILAEARRRGFSGRPFDQLLAQIRAGVSAGDPDELLALGDALTAFGEYDDAVASFRRALELRSDFAEAHFRLGSLLSETGRIAEGFRHYMRRAELVYGAGHNLEPPKQEPLHKTRHDHEQREYLGGDVFRLEEGERLAGPAVNPANVTPAMLEAWRNSRPQYVVLENFLVPEALEKLRRYCAGSTIWRKIYDAGYIGAAPEDGFACPLLAQIAEEIQSTFPEIFTGHAFRYLGAFKYDSELSTGTNIHADNSAVNVNFYIAPDEANLDPRSGGMDIWDVAMPLDIDMRTLNGNEAAAHEFLKRSNANVTVIPHRANRAVIFRSDLFHRTSDCRFKEGYLNKRINVSLLFGQRGAATR